MREKERESEREYSCRWRERKRDRGKQELLSTRTLLYLHTVVREKERGGRRTKL